MVKVLKILGILIVVLLFLSLPVLVFFKDSPLVKGLGGAVGKAIPSFGGKDEVDMEVMVIQQEEMTVADEHRSGTFLPGRQYLVNIPDGFNIEVVASKLGDVGPLAVVDGNTAFYAIRNKGEIYALRRDNEGVFSTERLVEPGELGKPIVDLAYSEGWLYVFNGTTVDRHDVVDGALGEVQELLIENLPVARGNRGAILVTPTGKLYVSINGGCVLCEPDDERRGSVIEVDIATKENRIFARGLREVEAMYFDEAAGTILAGDNKISDRESPAYAELNVLTADKHYGWPYCYEDNKIFSQFYDTKVDFCAAAEPPVDFCSHCAELTSITPFLGEGWPNYLQGKLLLSFNGSKENGVASGYKLTLYDGGTEDSAEPYKDFLYGWLPGTENWGSPFDVVSTASKRLLISDNFAGAIYQVTFSAEK